MYNDEMSLKEIMVYMLRKIKILIYILLVAIVIGVIYTFVINKPTYKVTAKILIDNFDASIVDFIKSKDVLFYNGVEPSFDKNSKIITIATKSNDEKEAFEVTNAYISNLETRLVEVYNIGKFTIIETPNSTEGEGFKEHIYDIFVFTIIGVVIYIIYITIKINNSGIMNEYQVENDSGIKVFASVKLKRNKKSQEDEFSKIMANIQLNKDCPNPKSIIITSTNNLDGISFITNEIAKKYSKIYSNILVIDTDIKKARLTKLYNCIEEKGITDLLKLKNLDNVEKLVKKTDIKGVSILPIGKCMKNQDIFLNNNLSVILDGLKEKFDLVIVNSLPIIHNISSLAISKNVDATILVIQHEKTKIEEVLKAKSIIQNIGGKILGIVISKT